MDLASEQVKIFKKRGLMTKPATSEDNGAGQKSIESTYALRSYRNNLKLSIE